MGTMCQSHPVLTGRTSKSLGSSLITFLIRIDGEAEVFTQEALLNNGPTLGSRHAWETLGTRARVPEGRGGRGAQVIGPSLPRLGVPERLLAGLCPSWLSLRGVCWAHQCFDTGCTSFAAVTPPPHAQAVR